MRRKTKNKYAKYYLDERKEQFVIENYNFSKPFANFFPGIAGRYGIPMWVFYVNRGQGIVSLGTKDKDHAILEFFPANKAWQVATLGGFRTFIKLIDAKKPAFYEPFHNGFANSGFDLTNRMNITSYDLQLKEKNLSLGLEVEVEYFTIPDDSYAALARIVTVRNTGSATKKMQLIDGLPQIVPFGTSNLFLKKLGRTIEAWMDIKNLDKNIPFYKLDVDPADRPEVMHIKEGNFYLGFHYQKNTPKIIRPIVDPQQIFGPVMDFSCPYQFLSQENFRYPKEQITKNKTPCGFTFSNLELSKNEAKTFYCLVGYMRNQGILNILASRIIRPGYLDRKKEENKRVIEELQRDIMTASSSPAFNLYTKQTYLDNILRGGYPVIFNTQNKRTVFYLYSRKHGDLERDYNKFQIQPTYFSQGNGNYRDINQNRRCDVWFNPGIEEENVITFFNLLQSDGFNPLVVKGASFILKDEKDFREAMKDCVEEGILSRIIPFLNKPFTPGEIILFLQENKIKPGISFDEFLDRLIGRCEKIQEAEHGEGFWIDHWTYNLDLLESYLGIYPERLRELIFNKRVFTFYDNTETVRPREEKYVLRDGKVRQLHSVVPDNAKREIIKKRESHPHIARAQYGSGKIYETSLVNKLLCLLANKLASFDPFGSGIEMEADKPNWFDALNGLPALFGSSLCETFELKRLVLLIKDALAKTRIDKITVTEEIHDFLANLNKLMREYLDSNLPDRDYRYWDKSHSLKEEYRHKTKFGFSGNELEMESARLNSILDAALRKIDLGIDSGNVKKGNIYAPYFINEVVEYSDLKPPYVKPTKFLQKRLPLFLEAQMHALRLTEDGVKAKALYKEIKASTLYDKKLKMYKVTESLLEMPEEIGRCRVFTRGWLEHESIWLHMEYKYLLEILKHGLYAEFYEDFKNVLIPFQEPARYGRSILENSSFLASSAFPDSKLHGNGFVARLSGSTAEFLQIWLVMNLGPCPFTLDSANQLNLRLNPVLKGWLFNKKDNTYSFNFLSRVCVTYHNPKKKDTFGKDAATPHRIVFKDQDNNPVEILSDTIPHPYAEQIRSRQILKIDVYLDKKTNL